MSQPLTDRLRRALTDARRARDDVAVSVLRTSLAALANAEAVDAAGSKAATGVYATEVARHELDDTEVRAIVTAERDELAEAAAAYGAIGQDEQAAVLTRQVALLDHILTEAT